MSRRYITRAVLRDLEAQLGDNDLRVLRSVSDLRFMSGHQLARMHFGGSDATSARATRRALLRLLHGELLQRLPRVVGGVRAGSKGFVYVLGIAGQKLAMEHGWQPRRRGRRSRSVGTFFLEHCLAVAELHVMVTEADRQGRLELMELAGEPACHRTYAGLGSQRILKPDSFVRFGLGDFECAFFIEVDRSTEGGSTIGRKLREYLTYEASGSEQARHGVFPKVLWLVPDMTRGEVLRAEIGALGAGGHGLFEVAGLGAAIEAMTAPGEAESHWNG